jgi:BirA family biotin operon repressor/biotin-[acetyl-CoA-carboxylase] ligase
VIHETGSTNDDLKVAARAGALEGSVLIAEAQREGRGRLGRSWHSPAGANLYLSVLLRPDLDDLVSLPVLALVAGVAVAEAIDEVTRVPTRLKWPNDVMVGGRKLAGILAEVGDTKPMALVLGIGINVNQRDFPEDLEEIATSLLICRGVETDRATLVAAVLRHLHLRTAQFEREGSDQLLECWMARSRTMGSRIRTSDGREGRISGLDSSGALRATDDSGRTFRVVGGPIQEILE